MVQDRALGLGARLLALAVGFWAGLQTVPPILAILRAKTALAVLGSEPQSRAAGLGVAFLASANPVQLALWILAGPLYALAALSLAGVKLGPARDYYGTALLLEAAVWATFRRGLAYVLLPAPMRLAVFFIVLLLLLGYGLVILHDARGRPALRRGPATRPSD